MAIIDGILTLFLEHDSTGVTEEFKVQLFAKDAFENDLKPLQEVFVDNSGVMIHRYTNVGAGNYVVTVQGLVGTSASDSITIPNIILSEYNGRDN